MSSPPVVGRPLAEGDGRRPGRAVEGVEIGTGVAPLQALRAGIERGCDGGVGLRPLSSEARGHAVLGRQRSSGYIHSRSSTSWAIAAVGPEGPDGR